MEQVSTLIRSSHPRSEARDHRMNRRLQQHVYPAHLQVVLMLTGNDGRPRQYDCWNVECFTPAAVKQVKSYLNQAVKQLNGQVVGPDLPTTE